MKVNFLLAEEIRPEVEGKLSVLGLFAGNTVLVGAPPVEAPMNAAAAIERLAILAVVSSTKPGKHKFSGRIFDPENNLYKPDAKFGEADIPEGYSHSIIIELKPFVIKTFGTYRLEFFVDGEPHKFEFQVRAKP